MIFGRSRKHELRNMDKKTCLNLENKSVTRVPYPNLIKQSEQHGRNNLTLLNGKERGKKSDQNVEDGDMKESELCRLCRSADWNVLQSWLEDHSRSSIEPVILSAKLGLKREIKSNNLTILHMLCSQKGVPFYIVHRIISLAPKSCQIADSDGRLPIHYAILAGADPRINNLLILTYPELLRIADRTGLLSILSRSRLNAK